MQQILHARDGIIREPRVFFDRMTLADTTVEAVRSNPACFVNGEAYPIKIHAFTTAVMPTGDERDIQVIGLRITYHDWVYQQREFMAAPLWLNRCVASPRPMSHGLSAWEFHQPFVFAPGDTMSLKMQLRAGATDRVGVFSMTGVGMESFRPFRRTGILDFPSTGVTGVNPQSFRNDGDESILITECTMHLSDSAEAANLFGNIRDLSIQISRSGSGTTALWTQGPDDGTLCPAILLGRNSGRAVVHEFPAPLVLLPGDGLMVEAQPLANSAREETIGVAMLGTIECV